MVIADSRAPRDGDFVEVVGHYNPRANPKVLELKADRIKHWRSVGAQPSETVHRLLYREGIWDVGPPKRPTKPSRAEREAAEAAATAEAEAEVEAAAAAAAAAAAKIDYSSATEESE